LFHCSLKHIPLLRPAWLSSSLPSALPRLYRFSDARIDIIVSFESI
jgi:hypothetical protein